jgi:DNA-binding response OmpR family regulator
MSPATPAYERIMSEKILVVEDNPITRKLLQAALAADGFEVSAVARASEVDAALQGGAPDLVLLDLMLPDATGFDVLAQLRANPDTERVPVLAVSGLSDGDRILGAGFTDHLLKPIEPSQLVDRIRLHLRAAHSPRPAVQRVLVVDDDPVQCKLAELTLGSCGFAVASAREAFEALTLARDFKPDVIVSDIVMPGVDGVQLCRAIRLEPELSRVPVVLASSRELDRVDRDLGARAGASAMVTPATVAASRCAAISGSRRRHAPASASSSASSICCSTQSTVSSRSRWIEFVLLLDHTGFGGRMTTSC